MANAINGVMQQESVRTKWFELTNLVKLTNKFVEGLVLRGWRTNYVGPRLA